MTEDQVAEAVTAWARATLDELQAGYSWLSANKGSLPDVMVDVAEKAIRLRDDRFPTLDVEQAALRIFEIEAMFMVAIDSADVPGGQTVDQAETKLLRSFGERLEASLLSDGTLGDRVYAASPLVTFDYRLPFVQYRDGTRGRQMSASFPVADPVTAAEVSA